jgi:hypothetical protein
MRHLSVRDVGFEQFSNAGGNSTRLSCSALPFTHREVEIR